MTTNSQNKPVLNLNDNNPARKPQKRRGKRHNQFSHPSPVFRKENEPVSDIKHWRGLKRKGGLGFSAPARPEIKVCDVPNFFNPEEFRMPSYTPEMKVEEEWLEEVENNRNLNLKIEVEALIRSMFTATPNNDASCFHSYMFGCYNCMQLWYGRTLQGQHERPKNAVCPVCGSDTIIQGNKIVRIALKLMKWYWVYVMEKAGLPALEVDENTKNAKNIPKK